MKKCIAIVITVVLIIVSCTLAVAADEYQYAKVVTQKGPLNMRKDTSRKADIIGKIPRDTIVEVTPVDDKWCKCVYQGKNGYIMTDYLSFMDTSQFRSLAQNDTGQDVMELKEKLRELYFFDADAELDDRYDSNTEAVVKLFQSAQGMEETGIATPALQALMHWGNPRNNLPTKKMTVNISCNCSSYNHVGQNWASYFGINGEGVSSGDTLDIVLGETLSIYSKITEKDKYPDVGSIKEDVEISQQFYDEGFTVTHKISVRENKGRYAGNKAHWLVTYVFSP